MKMLAKSAYDVRTSSRKDVMCNRAFWGCGAQYDPLFGPSEMWPIHVEQMKDAGLSFVRLYEFCWSGFEPEEGRYEFAWADEFLDLLDKNEIRYILCTPGAAPPNWLTFNYPETVIVHADGRRDRCETRRHGCPSSTVFLERCLNLSRLLAERYGRREGLIGWQIDNELGHPVCYCEFCESAFRSWLQEYFVSLDELNRRLGTVFWGHTYDDWSQIRIPHRGSPGLLHMFRRWTSAQWISYIRCHVDELRPLTDKPISTNMMAPWHGYDHYEAARHLDIVGMDYYPHGGSSVTYSYSNTDMDFMLGYTRAIAEGKPFWMLETEVAGHERRTPRPGLLKEWTLRQIGHGANLVNFFRWDTPPFGEEGAESGVVGPGSWISPAFDEVKKTCLHVGQIATKTEQTTPRPAKVAVLFTYPSWWKFLDNPPCPLLIENSTHGYPHLVRRHCHGLSENGIAYDIIGPDGNWEAYPCLIIPHCLVVDDALAHRCRDYVQQGGSLLMTAMSGIYNEEGVAHNAPYPFGVLGELFGVECTANGNLVPDAGEVVLDIKESLPVDGWADQLHVLADDLSILGRYQHPFYGAFPALTCRQEGKGLALYLGTVLTQHDMPVFYSRILKHLGIVPNDSLPPNVWSRSRIDATGQLLWFTQNTGEDAVTFALSSGDSVTLCPHETYVSNECDL